MVQLLGIPPAARGIPQSEVAFDGYLGGYYMDMATNIADWDWMNFFVSMLIMLSMFVHTLYVA